MTFTRECTNSKRDIPHRVRVRQVAPGRLERLEMTGSGASDREAL